MKMLKYLSFLSVSLMLFSCTKSEMDSVNEDLNNTTEMSSPNIIPDAILKTGFESNNTDIAWYSSVFIEHSTGTWGQFYQADRRSALNSASLMNNSWNSLYDVMNECNTIIKKTDPTSGNEPTSYFTRGVGQILMAYNLAITTDMWGEVPYTEAFKGLDNLKPAYDKQSDLYVKIQALLDDAIVNLGKAPASNNSIADKDYIYGGKSDSWIKAAYSLKARFYLRLTQKDANAATKAIAAAANGFSSDGDEMLLTIFDGNSLNNPWAGLWYERSGLSTSATFETFLTERNDPRLKWLVVSDDDGPAPNGNSEQTQAGYDVSALSTGWNGFAYPVPMMTYHELQFILAEAKFRAGDATWQNSLKDAITASFTYIQTYFTDIDDVVYTVDADTYYTNEVLPRLTAGNELKEILTQKFIAGYEFEAIEAYNDYRRTGVPTLNNPLNSTIGFVNRFPFAHSEVSNNPANVPACNIYTDKVWWAGGSEKL